jgi:hypothetical protein
MSVSLLPPDLRRILGDLANRIGILERRVTTAATSVDSSHYIGFSYAGVLAASTSPPTRVWRGGNLTVLAVSLGTAGSTSTVIAVKRNGTTVGTVTVPSGAVIYNGEVSARFAADSDLLTLQITTAGTGAADMTAAARFT